MSVSLSLPTHPFTRAQAPELCLSRSRLSDALAQGQLRRVLRNVYVRADAPDSVETRAAAAALVVTPGAVFVDRTAAWLHGVDVFDYRELEILPPVECVVLRDRSRIQRPETVGGERDLAPWDVTRLHGLRVTTPLRTALDLGCLLSRPDALAALDMFLRHGVREWEILESLGRYRRRRGVVKLREMANLMDARAESARESRTRLAIHDADLPAPQPQYWVMEHGVRVFRLDLAYPRHRVAVEYDGRDWHDRTEEQLEVDRKRRAWLEERGWTIIVVRRGDFSAGRRGEWLRQLRTALGPR